MRFSALALTVCALVATQGQATGAHASNISAATVDEIDTVFAHLDSIHSPGCSLGVIQNGELVLRRSYGMASLEQGTPIDSRTVFYVGSVSKQFVAAAVLLASLEGHLSLDDGIRRYFPELPSYAEPIRIRNLVHHTSGLRDYLGLMALAGIAHENVFSEREVLELIARQQELNFEPGDQYLYSNSGYFLMAQLVPRATGRTLRQYTEEKIFAPLGMHDTHFHDDRLQIVPRRAAAYAPAEGEEERDEEAKDGKTGKRDFVVNWSPAFAQVGSGGLLTTVEDLLQWDRSFYSDALGTNFWARMLEAGQLANGEALDYAFGLTVDRYRGARRIHHGGAMFGYRAQLARLPDQKTSIAVLCNLSDSEPGVLAMRVADLILETQLDAIEQNPPDNAAEQEDESSPAAADHETVAALVGRYWSEELGVAYTLLLENDALHLRIGSNPPQPLQAFADGTFAFSYVRGTTEPSAGANGDGPVGGFTLQAGRVRNLRFERVDN